MYIPHNTELLGPVTRQSPSVALVPSIRQIREGSRKWSLIRQRKKRTGQDRTGNKPCFGSSCPPCRSCYLNAGHLIPLPPLAGTAPSCYLPSLKKQTPHSSNGWEGIMPGGLTLRRRGCRLVAPTESGLNSQPGGQNKTCGAGWLRGLQLSTGSPPFHSDPWAPSRPGAQLESQARPASHHLSTPNNTRRL